MGREYQKGLWTVAKSRILEVSNAAGNLHPSKLPVTCTMPIQQFRGTPSYAMPSLDNTQADAHTILPA